MTVPDDGWIRDIISPVTELTSIERRRVDYMDYLMGNEYQLVGLDAGFGNLPVDPYTDGNFRFRRFSTFDYRNNAVSLLAPETFMQSSDLNAFLGDVERTYEAIEEITYSNPLFTEMFRLFDEHTTIRIASHVGVHQIRIFKVGDHQMAPEGRHQDGFDRIAIYMINSVNISGGHLRLSLNQHDDAFLDKELAPGDYAILNDRKLFHNASPIELIDETLAGYVDVFVLTAKEHAVT